MTQEQKDLLLKDLCARLPYGVKVQCEDYLFTFDKDHMGIGMLYKDFNMNLLESPKIILSGCYYGEDIKPYLFPLSSMTDEMWDKEFMGCGITEFTRDSFKYGCETLAFNNCNPNLSSTVRFINQLIKNHFDIYGLIEKGLAIDATGLNIY